MAVFPIALPYQRQFRHRVLVRPELRPIGGVQPGAFGFTDTKIGDVLTLGSGITLANKPEGVVQDWSSSNTGLTKAVSYTDHPFSFVFAGRIDGQAGNQCLGSIATTADKTCRVFGAGGTIFGQHIGATTNASATTAAVWEFGKYFVGVAVFASPTEVRAYCAGSAGRSHAVNVTNVGALGALTKFCVGTYDGSVKTTPCDGQAIIAQWLRVALTPNQAWEIINNPWSIFEPEEILVPYDAPVSDGGAVLTRARTTHGFRAGSRQAA